MNIGRALRKLAGRILGHFDYDVVKRTTVEGKLPPTPIDDFRRLLAHVPTPMILDVGGNIGQSVDLFTAHFPTATVHTFEPAPEAFAQLARKCDVLERVSAWKMAVGSGTCKMPLGISTQSVMSSFLEHGPYSWAEKASQLEVEVTSLDEFAEQQGIELIHVLKSDTQGFELEVLKGADRLMTSGRIAVIMFEHTFLEMYQGGPEFDDIFRFLKQRGYLLANIHNLHYQKGLLSWMDLIFIHEDFYRDCVPEEAKANSPLVPDPLLKKNQAHSQQPHMRNPFKDKLKKQPPNEVSSPPDPEDVLRKLSAVEQPFRDALISMYRGEPQEGVDGKMHRLDDNTRISVEQGLHLHDLIISRKCNRTLEIGMAYGFSTLYILAALAKNGNGQHTAIDPFQSTHWGGVGLVHAKACAPHRDGVTCFRLLEDRSDRVSADFARQSSHFDFIFIDGNHRYDDVLTDFYLYAQLCCVGGLIIFDDMWMQSIRAVVDFVRTNRPDFREVACPVGNISIFEKTSEDGRDWRHFRPFNGTGAA